MSDIAERTRRVVTEYLNENGLLPPGFVLADDTPFSDLDFDSLDAVELTVLLEDEFGFQDAGTAAGSINDIITELEKRNG